MVFTAMKLVKVIIVKITLKRLFAGDLSGRYRNQRIAATIRHNRARGRHQILPCQKSSVNSASWDGTIIKWQRAGNGQRRSATPEAN